MKPIILTGIQQDIVWEDKFRNLDNLSRAIALLPVTQNIIFLPEMFATGFSMNEKLAEPMSGTIVSWMKEQAMNLGKIICGSVMIREEDEFFNRLIWMLPNGRHHYYDKRHLFAFGGENKFFSAGEKRLVVQVNGWKICLMVCYDLRFPVWCRQQNELYDVLVFVANWPEKRRQAWSCLLQARAIENQCYVLGVNRVGKDGHGIAHSGDSILIDPMGNSVVMAAAGEASVFQGALSPRFIEDTRSHFPFLNDADRFLIV